ncbi:leptin b [Electrophorus electricus]|uniref:leptin b n=1 Tax=Electrophorus electricus TaxID=8005 RepID=UPI0015D0C4ED|nr:leptin b [Electrophorus electricus]
MHSAVALSCIVMAAVLALVVCHPTADMVCIIAKTSVSRIKRIKEEYFQMSPDIDFDRDHDTPIQGLTSILTHLGNLQVRLKVYPAHYLRQLQLDLEVMITYLESLAVSLRCSLPKPMTILHKHDTTFPITSSYLCLLELQSYMERFCLNLDKLHYC